MGQYYYAIILKANTNDENIKENENILLWMSPHNYGNGAKLMEHSYIGNDFVETMEYLISPEGMYHKSPIVWAGDYAYDNLYSLTTDETRYIFGCPKTFNASEYQYIVNHTLKMYVDKKKENNNIHPLPLLVSEGNGNGSGDYGGDNDELCGLWSRHVISVEKNIPENYTQLLCNFNYL
jgi:hypothetical protein